jgi:LmbE family N-acetylglucosaminyl deacetylase
MLKFEFAINRERPLNVLCLGAHSDDIEIGCGGTILRLLAEHAHLHVTWVVLSAHGVRRDEALTSADSFLSGAEGKRILPQSFRDGFFPYQGEEIKEFFESLKSNPSPDLIFTHYRQDRHQDHRVVSDFTWNTFRDHLILEYEIMKYDGDLGAPNFFVNLDRPTCGRKVAQIMDIFKTQADHRWFTEDAFWSLLRVRGVECNAPEGYAEAFYSRKAAK